MSTPTTPPVSPRTPATPIQGTPKKPGNNTWGSWSVDIFDPTSKEIENYLYQISHSKAYWHSTWLALLPAPVTALYDAAASLAQGAGKTVIWFVDFNQSKEELIFDIAGTALLNLLRSGRLMLALPILAVVGRLFPQTFFDGLNYTPQTTEGEKNKLIGEQSAKLADAQNNLAAEREKKLTQASGTVSTMAGSPTESQRLQTLVTELTEQESALKKAQEAFKALTAQHEVCTNQQAALVQRHADLSTNVIPGLEGQEKTLRATLTQLTDQEADLVVQIEAKKLEIQGSDATLQLKGQEAQTALEEVQQKTKEAATEQKLALEVQQLKAGNEALRTQIDELKDKILQLVKKMDTDRVVHSQQLAQLAKKAKQDEKAKQEDIKQAEKNLRDKIQAEKKKQEAIATEEVQKKANALRETLSASFKKEKAELEALKEQTKAAQAELTSLQNEVGALRLERDKVLPASAAAPDQTDD